MKKLITTCVAFVIVSFTFAQSPDLFSYQAVVRDNAGNAVASSSVSLRFSILQTTATGIAQYVETHNPTTDANGLVSLMIGGGTVTSGTFASIDWANDKFFLKVELDPAGGSSYSNMGTTQLISVPYAKHAETSMRAINDSIYDGDSSRTNELQALSKSGDTIFLSNGGFVQIPPNWDSDSTNELQQLSISNDTIYLSKGGFAVIPDSSLLGVKKGGSGAGAGGSADLSDFSSSFKEVYKLGEDFSVIEIKVDQNKNVFVFGYFSGESTIGATTVTTNNSGTDVLLAKFDSSGVLLWEKHSTNGDANVNEFVSRLELSGSDAYVSYWRWNRQQTALNFGGINHTNTDSNNVQIIKVNGSGTVQWATGMYCLLVGTNGSINTFGSNLRGIGANAAGEVFYSGTFKEILVSGNTSLQLGSGSNYLVFGKISSNGQTHTIIDTAKSCNGGDLIVDQSGNPILIGSGASNVNIGNTNRTLTFRGFLVRYSPSGTVLNFSNELDYSPINGIIYQGQLEANSTNVYLTGVMDGGRIGNLYSIPGAPYSLVSFLVQFNNSLALQRITDIRYNEAQSANVSVDGTGGVLWGVTEKDSYILNDKIYYTVGGSSGTAASMNSSLTTTEVKSLNTFGFAEGLYVGSSGGTNFFVGTCNANFYNKGAKYTSGVYLFKE